MIDRHTKFTVFHLYIYFDVRNRYSTLQDRTELEIHSPYIV
jgi:hypothetical protein